MEYNDNLDLSKFVYESHLKSLISIYKDIEIVSNNKIVEIENEIKKLSIANTKKHISIFNLSDEMFDYYSHYNYHIHYNLMNSLFISAFSLFENHISKIAEIATEKYKPLIRINDIKGNGELDTIRKYLNIVINLKSANSDYKNWQDLLHYKALRNAIVHNGSILNKSKKDKIENIVGFELIKKYNIWYSPSNIYFRIKEIVFLEDFAKLTLDYSQNIINELID